MLSSGCEVELDTFVLEDGCETEPRPDPAQDERFMILP